MSCGVVVGLQGVGGALLFRAVYGRIWCREKRCVGLRVVGLALVAWLFPVGDGLWRCCKCLVC